MMYSLSTIKTIADCDILLNIAKREKSDLEYRKITLDRRQTDSSENSVDLESEFQLTTAEITALKLIIPNLPEGATKKYNASKLVKLEHKLFLLTERKGTQGALAVVDAQFDIARIEGELAATEDYLQVLEARKAELDIVPVLYFFV